MSRKYKSSGKQLFDSEAAFAGEPKESSRDVRCTPDLLLEFILKIGHYPTIAELQGEFGGILGPIMDGHILKETGRWPVFTKKPKGDGDNQGDIFNG